MQQFKSIQELIHKLSNHPSVLGLLEFGSRHYADDNANGDYDLLVILDKLTYSLRSIHFFVGDIGVDLNVRSIDDLPNLQIATGFERAFLESRIIYDRTGKVTLLMEMLREKSANSETLAISENRVAMIRHWHRHVLDKVAGRLDSQPVFCDFMLNTDIFWLIENYFRIRHLDYKGPKKAFEYLTLHEPELYTIIQKFYEVSDLHEKINFIHKLTQLVLAPVGGMWQNNEIIAFGTDDNLSLSEQAQSLFNTLFYKLE